MNNERFLVPEVLFSPGDLGLQQAGLAEAIVQSLEGVHESLHPLLLSNVLLTGGTVACPGFAQRLLADLRPLVSDEFEVPV